MKGAPHLLTASLLVGGLFLTAPSPMAEDKNYLGSLREITGHEKFFDEEIREAFLTNGDLDPSEIQEIVYFSQGFFLSPTQNLGTGIFLGKKKTTTPSP